MKGFKSGTALLILIIALFSCKKETPQNNAQLFPEDCFYHSSNATLYLDTNYSETGMIPIHNNNYWRFADTTWKDDSILYNVEEFILEPASAHAYDSEIWWSTSFFSLGKFHQSGDTLYGKTQYAYPCYEKIARYYPFVEDSIEYTTVSDMDNEAHIKAFRIASFETPVGTFTDCYRFEQTSPFRDNVIVFKPGIGIIYYELYSPPTTDWETLVRFGVLQEYHIE